MPDPPEPFLSTTSHHATDPFRLLVESVVDYAIKTVDPAGLISSWNPGAERIFGYKAAEIIGQHYATVASPAEVPPEEIWQIALSSGHYQFECLRCRKDQSQFWANVTISAIKDHFGNHAGFSVVTRDISERKRAEKAIKQERDFSNAILSSLPGVYYIYDENRSFLRWNARFETVCGYTGEEIQGMHPLDFFSPEDRSRVSQSIATVFSEGICEVEADFVTKSGERIPHYFNGVQMEVEGRRCLLGMGIDITQQVQAREEQRSTAALLYAVVHGTPDALFVKDLSGKYILCNPAAATAIGKPASEILGCVDEELFDAQSAQIAREMDQRVITNDRTESQEEELTGAGGTRTFQATKMPLRDADGKISGVLGISRDVTEQKRAQTALRQQETLLRIASKVARLGGWSLDLAANQLIWSDEVRDIHEEPVGHVPTLAGALEYYTPEYREWIERCVQTCGREGTPFECEAELVTAKGRRIWVRSIGEAVRNSSGEIIGLQGAFTDVSARKNAEDESQRLAKQLATTLETMNDGFILLDREWRFTYVNTKAIRLIHQDREQLLGTTLWEAFPGVLGITFEKEYRRALEEEITVDFEEYFAPLAIWFEVRAHPTDQGLAIYFRDVTAKHEAQETVRVNEERFRLLSKATSDIVWEWDMVTGAHSWNEGVTTVFGYPRAEIQPVVDFCLTRIHPEDFEEVNAIVGEAISSGAESWSAEYRFRHREGHYVPILDSAYIIRNAEGQPIQMLGGMKDLTGRKALETQLRQAQKMEAVGQLAGGVAHDFNNLLTVISGYSELLLDMPEVDSIVRDAVTSINEAGDRAATLTRQLLGFSRQSLLQPKVLDLNEVVADITSMLRRLIGEDIHFATVLSPDLNRVKVDPGQLDQVLMNLAVNARDAMPTGGKLTVETRNVHLSEEYASTRLDCKAGPYVMLAMSDTGCGMTPEVMSHIFEPFFTTKEVGRGTGLGLAMVFGIVQQSGGCIHVYSEPERGTTFKIYLPVVSEPSSVKVEVELQTDLRGNETVLVVEDDESVRNLTKMSLEMQGYRVLTATDGKDALGIVDRHTGPLDLVLTDIVMPNISGPELVYRLNTEFPKVKVLFMSGYTDDAVVRHGLIEEEMGFIQKPYTPSGLAQKVRQVLDAR